MIFEDEEQRKVFGLKCTLAEKTHTQNALVWVEKEIDNLNQKAENLGSRIQSSSNNSVKKELEETLISCMGKLRYLYTYQKVLKYQLTIVKSTSQNSGTLGFRAKKAESELKEMEIY